MLWASRQGCMGIFRITLLSLPDRGAAQNFFLLQGICFPPILAFPGKGVCVFGSAAVSVCLFVAGFGTDTSTGGRHKLNPVALVVLSTTRLHWVAASHVSAVGLSAVWVPTSWVSWDVFLHLHSSETWVWARAWGDSNWAVLLPVCVLLLPKALSGTRFGLRLSAQQAWSIYEEAAWRHGKQHSSS